MHKIFTAQMTRVEFNLSFKEAIRSLDEPAGRPTAGFGKLQMIPEPAVQELLDNVEPTCSNPRNVSNAHIEQIENCQK